MVEYGQKVVYSVVTPFTVDVIVDSLTEGATGTLVEETEKTDELDIVPVSVVVDSLTELDP